MGGMELDENGATTRRKVDWNVIWRVLDSLEGYTGQEVHHILSITPSARRGECELNHDWTHILFPLFLYAGSLDATGMWDEDVIEV